MLFDSKRESEGYSDVIDFRMSREFGLDWKEYDFARMNAFIELLRLENKRQDMDNKKQSDRNKSYSNYR